MLQFSIQDIHFLQVEPTRSLQLNLSFEAGYKGASIHNSSPVHYDHDLLNQVNDDMNNRQLDDEFLMRLMKKFDEIEEQKL